MKSPTELRKRLFRKSKPVIRPMTASDMKWIWAAYKAGSFPNIREMGESEFKSMFASHSTRYQSIDIYEDVNSGFSSGFGPVAIIFSTFDGWRFEPHVDWFKWATPRNILRGTVAYVQKIRYRKGIGVVILKSLKDTKPLFDKTIEYGVLHYRGKVPNGDPRGDEYLYSTRGTLKTEEEKNVQKP